MFHLFSTTVQFTHKSTGILKVSVGEGAKIKLKLYLKVSKARVPLEIELKLASEFFLLVKLSPRVD